jgi:hypothetical protein
MPHQLLLYVMSNRRMVCEWWPREYVEECRTDYSYICLRALRKVTKPLSSDGLYLVQNSNSWPHEFEAGILTTQARCSIITLCELRSSACDFAILQSTYTFWSPEIMLDVSKLCSRPTEQNAFRDHRTKLLQEKMERFFRHTNRCFCYFAHNIFLSRYAIIRWYLRHIQMVTEFSKITMLV